MSAMFTDSLEANLGLIEELLRDLPPEKRNQARLAAASIEKVVVGLQKDTQGNVGAALGAAYAIYKIAQRLVTADKGSAGESLIKLLN